MRHLRAGLLMLLPFSAAAEMAIEMHAVDDQGVGEMLGIVKISQSRYGTVFTPDLRGIAPGLHGFHVHEHGSCEPAVKDGRLTAAAAAGGHYDPHGAGRHGTPWGNGHLGDLPALYVDPDGNATHPVLAPRIKLDDVQGRALMIHAHGDNYSDQPKPLGGGGPRVACGVAGNGS